MVRTSSGDSVCGAFFLRFSCLTFERAADQQSANRIMI